MNLIKHTALMVVNQLRLHIKYETLYALVAEPNKVG